MKIIFKKLLKNYENAIIQIDKRNISFIPEIFAFTNEFLSNSVYYDFISSILRITNNIPNFEDNVPIEFYKRILDYSHDSNNICLYFDVEIMNSDDIEKKKLLLASYLLEISLNYFFNIPDSSILFSAEYQTFLYQKNQLLKYKIYLYLGLKVVPPYRVWNYKKQSMSTYDPKDINAYIEGIENEILSYKNLSKKLDSEVKRSLHQYYTHWWSKYKEYIEVNYPLIKERINYYNGVKITLLLCNYRLFDKNMFGSSKLALCTGISNNEKETLEIKIYDRISNITFLDEIFERDVDVTVTVAFDPLDMEKDTEKMIDSEIPIKVNEEIINLYKDNIEYDEFVNFSKNLFMAIDYQIIDKFTEIFLIKKDYITSNNDQYNLEFSSNTSKEIFEDIKNRKKKESKVIIVNKSIINSTLKNKYKNENIFVKDIDDIFSIAKHEILYSQNKKINLLVNEINPFLMKRIGHLQTKSVSSISDDLISEIKKCPLGTSGWKQFEFITSKILKYVFEKSFRNYLIKEQVRNTIGTDIKDFIINNNGIHDFWKDLIHFYRCSNIVIECKNYTDEIGIDELRQVSDYLEKDTFGRFGLIFSRKGLNSSAKLKQLDYLRNSQRKLILVLSQDDIIDLIRKKSMNEYPEEILEYLKFDLETQI